MVVILPAIGGAEGVMAETGIVGQWPLRADSPACLDEFFADVCDLFSPCGPMLGIGPRQRAPIRRGCCPKERKAFIMLTNAAVTTMLPVIDLARARAFYEGSLGLKPEGFRPDGKFVYCVGGSTLALFPKPSGTKADHTAISFKAPDIAAGIARLKEAGVRFEDYDFPGLKTIGHVCVLGAEKAAWSKDPEGNTLCIHEDISSG